jgi:hypothetical protein
MSAPDSFDAYCKAQRERIERNIEGRSGRMEGMEQRYGLELRQERGCKGGQHYMGPKRPSMDSQGPRALWIAGNRRRAMELPDVWSPLRKRTKGGKHE